MYIDFFVIRPTKIKAEVQRTERARGKKKGEKDKGRRK
jgi:hypothetical protein